jgi:hypothetical protein
MAGSPRSLRQPGFRRVWCLHPDKYIYDIVITCNQGKIKAVQHNLRFLSACRFFLKTAL